ncbi:MAG: hypothetical protein AAGD05_10265 [Bacteroidota bacterium]
MNLHLNKTNSDRGIVIYLGLTLILRLLLEPKLRHHYFISIALGSFCLLFLWALVKSEILNPGWFGWLEPRAPKK